MVTIPFTRVEKQSAVDASSAPRLPKSTKNDELCNRILELMKEDPGITKVRLQSLLDTSKSSINRAIKKLKEKGMLERLGPNKSGYWHVIE